MSDFKTYLLARLREASTWRGIVVLATSLGVALQPGQIEAIVAFGLGLAGVLAVFLPDQSKE